MNCSEARKLVHLFVDGALDPRANVDVLAHLNMCAACSARFEDAKKFEEFLRTKLRHEVTPPGVRLRLESGFARLGQPWPARMAWRLKRHPMAAMSGVAAVLAISLVGWQACGVMFTCPYVRASADHYLRITAGDLPMTVPSSAAALAGSVPVKNFGGLEHSGRGVFALSDNLRDAVGDAYRMTHCPTGSRCVVLFSVSLPGADIGNHDCVEMHGRKFTRWEYDGCRLVCWKDEKNGLYCIMVCKKQEMEDDALLNIASLAATE